MWLMPTQAQSYSAVSNVSTTQDSPEFTSAALVQESFEPASDQTFEHFQTPRFSLSVPHGWTMKRTESGDQFVFGPAPGMTGPVIRVFTFPMSTGQPGIGEFINRWQFTGKKIAEEIRKDRTYYSAEGIDARTGKTWTYSLGTATDDGYVRILQVDVPVELNDTWVESARMILESFDSSPAHLK